MKLFVAITFVAVCSAASLDNTYLPPATSYSAGGNGNFLGAPTSPSGQYSSSRQFATGSQYNKPQSYNSQQQYGGQYSAGHNGGASGQQIPIVRFSNENQGDGSYQFQYETANGIKQQEEGYPAGQDEEVVEGSYSYTGDDGQEYNVEYKADANGFQATGEHLPTPPPIPDAILKSLEINAVEEARESQSGYSYNAPSGSNAYARDGGYKGQSGASHSPRPYSSASSRNNAAYAPREYNKASNNKFSGPYSTGTTGQYSAATGKYSAGNTGPYAPARSSSFGSFPTGPGSSLSGQYSAGKTGPYAPARTSSFGSFPTGAGSSLSGQYSAGKTGPYAPARTSSFGSFPTGAGSSLSGQYAAGGRSGPYSASGSLSSGNIGQYSTKSNNQYASDEAEFTGYKY